MKIFIKYMLALILVLSFIPQFNADARKKKSTLYVKVFKKINNKKKALKKVNVEVSKLKTELFSETRKTNRKGKAVFKKLLRGKKYSVMVQRSGYTFSKSSKIVKVKRKKKTVSFIATKDEVSVTPMTKPATALIRVNADTDDRYFDFSKGENLQSGQDIWLGGFFFGSNYHPSINGLIVSSQGKTWKNADTAPESGYGTSEQPNSIDPELNGIYFVKTAESNYAKIMVRSIADTGEVVIDWFYQSDESRTFPSDSTAPEIASVKPVENSTGIEITTEFKVKFDEPITNSMSVAAEIEGGSKSLSFGFPSYDPAENALIFPLSENIEYDTVYTVSITTPSYYPDDYRYYVKDLSGNKLILDKSWTFRTETASSEFPGEIIFVHYFNDEIWKMDATGAKETLIYKDPKGVFYPKISPDGKKLLYFDISTENIYLLDVISDTVITVASSVGNPFTGSYDFSPDSSRIAYAPYNPKTNSYGINIYDISTKSTTNIYSLQATSLNWSRAASSEKIVFRDNVFTGMSEIDAVTEVVTQIYSGSAWNPVYSPDGNKVVLLIDDSSDNNNSKINIMNSDGTNLQRLTSETGDEYTPVWSPSGDRIAFIRDSKLYVIGNDGTNEISLVPSSTKIKRQEDPFWSPDGSYIAYSAYSEDFYDNFYYDIYVVKADGTENERAVTSQGDSRTPMWIP